MKRYQFDSTIEVEADDEIQARTILNHLVDTADLIDPHLNIVVCDVMTILEIRDGGVDDELPEGALGQYYTKGEMR